MIHREPLDDSGGLLTLAIRGGRSGDEDAELRAIVGRLGPGAARELARRNQVEALVGVGLAAAGAAVPPDWSAAVEANGRRVGDLLAALRAVVLQLDREGVPSAAIEAGGVMLGTEHQFASVIGRREEMGDRGRCLVLGRYTWALVAGRLLGEIRAAL